MKFIGDNEKLHQSTIFTIFETAQIKICRNTTIISSLTPESYSKKLK